MPFSMICSNRKCGKQMEPYIDPKTDKVYCSSCNNEITNITSFAKVQMKSLKQFKPKETTSFSVKCNICNKDGRPKLVNDDVVCGSCNRPLENLSNPFKLMLKEKLKTADKDVA